MPKENLDDVKTDLEEAELGMDEIKVI